MTPRDVINNLKTTMNSQSALSLAETMLKNLKKISLSDLPNYIDIANDSHTSDTLKKSLIRREHNKSKEVQKELSLWSNVVGILRKEVKA